MILEQNLEDLEELGNAKSESIQNLIDELAKEKLKRFSHAELMSFTSNTEIGVGGYGKVYKGQFPNGVEVAVKVLAEKDTAEETFMAEVRIMGRTYHRNLVKLYGFCFDYTMKALVYEYMKNGSLDKCLYENHLSIKWEKLYDIALETGKGLSYLHDSCEEQIIHHDIKAANVLLSSNLSPKITDFGLAKLLNRDMSHLTRSGTRGTPGYAAPETYNMPASKVTFKCDVYSFGMMLFEVLGRRKNRLDDEWFPKQVWEKFEKTQLDGLFKDCGIGEENKDKATVLCMVALWCIQFTPEIRPKMSTVVKFLEKEMQVMRMPPNPFFPHDSVSSLQPSYSHEVIYPEVSSANDESLQNNIHQGEEENMHQGEEENEPELNGREIGSVRSSSRSNELEAPQAPQAPQALQAPQARQAPEAPQAPQARMSYETQAESSDKSRCSKIKEAEAILRLFKRKSYSGHSVVMYTTTKGLRKSVKESNEVRSILQSYKNQVDIIEKDCSLNADCNDDLRKLCGKIEKPVVFVRGRLIGGANEVKKLEEEGKLKILFQGLSLYKKKVN